MVDTKTCTKCGERKALTDFPKHRSHKDGHEHRCKACKALSDAARYRKNVEHFRANEKRWRKENRDRKNALLARRRACKKQAKLEWTEEVQKEAIAAKYALREHYTAATGIEHHVDHIWPLKGFPTVFKDFDEKDIDFDLLLPHFLILWEDSFRGLHVAHNLEVIPATENLSKSNKRPVDKDGNERPACKWSKTKYDY